MTIFFPDVSKVGQGPLVIQPKTVALVAKATEGTDFTDGNYAEFKAQAAKVGAEFCAYHFIWDGSLAEAKHAFSVVGPKVPLSVDAENTKHATGLATILSFVHFYRQLGGIVHVVYLPHWYWQSLGSPDLTPLLKAGLVLNSSDYASYSDTGDGWQPYGGVKPEIWQYTDKLPYGGQTVDFNAFEGTVQELHNVWHFGTRVGPKPIPVPAPKLPPNMAEAIKRLQTALKFHPTGAIANRLRQALKALGGK